MKTTHCFSRFIVSTAAIALLAGTGPVFAATYVVSNNADTGPGSLRQAVLDSNASGGSNFINIVVDGTTTVSSGELLVTKDVTIQGIGPAWFILQGNYSSRIFHFSNAVVTLSGMTIANGSNNLGGAILQQSGSLTISNCVLMRNKAIDGGAIAQTNGSLFIFDSTISTNSAAGTGLGIVIQGNLANAAIRRSTLAGNTGTGFTSSGGGITHNGSSLLLENCTFCDNGSTGGDGGGVLNKSGTTTIYSCTVVANRSFLGGGIASEGGAVFVRNTIVARNTSISGAGEAPDFFGEVISGGFNLVGNRTNSTGWNALTDQLGSGALPLNPILLPLTNNGGATWTMMPLSVSPVVDKGDSGGNNTDQRGLFRPYDKFVPNASGGDGADIGAVELGVRTQLVTTVASTGPGSLLQAVLNANAQEITQIEFQPGIGAAIQLNSELSLDRDFIIHGPGAAAMALVAAPNQRVLSLYDAKVTISGLTFRGGHIAGSKGGFETEGTEAYAGGILNAGNLSLIDCEISNNSVTGGAGGDTDNGTAANGAQAVGGGILNAGVLAMTRCVVANNYATGGDGGQATGDGFEGQGGPGYGAGISTSGELYLTNCSIYGNQAAGGWNSEGRGYCAGGGIRIYANNVLALMTSTVASNRAIGIGAKGGGIYDPGDSSVYRNSTIAGNQAAIGGGVAAEGSDFANTVIAANVANTGPDISGLIVSSDYNLIQNSNSLISFGPVAHTIYGQDPRLAPLQNNGGPTPTMALLPGSPAIDHGTNFGIFMDQRGRPRPIDLQEVPNAPGGNGTDIGAFEAFPLTLQIVRSGSSAILSWPTNDPSFHLEATTNLALPGAWAPVPGTPAISSNRFILADPLQARKYYRLRSP